jgi:hypothetical protein
MPEWNQHCGLEQCVAWLPPMQHLPTWKARLLTLSQACYVCPERAAGRPVEPRPAALGAARS